MQLDQRRLPPPPLPLFTNMSPETLLPPPEASPGSIYLFEAERLAVCPPRT